MSEECTQMWIGDWNGHIGRHQLPYHDGNHYNCGLDIGTTAGGNMVKNFMNTAHLRPIDYRRVIARRGTWRHTYTGKWYELDYFALPTTHHGMIARIKTIGLSSNFDHAMKQYTIDTRKLLSPTQMGNSLEELPEDLQHDWPVQKVRRAECRHLQVVGADYIIAYCEGELPRCHAADYG